MVTEVRGYWLHFEPFDFQESLDEVFAHYGVTVTIEFQIGQKTVFMCIINNIQISP
jgi:hypothetical protein